MKRVFISQPMSGYDEEKVLLIRNKAMKEIIKLYPNEGIYFIDNFSLEENAKNKKPLEYLGKDIELLANADMIFISDDFFDRKMNGKISLGCEAELYIAKLYEIPVYNLKGTEISELISPLTFSSHLED